jgi:hypothetical protein
VGYKKAGNQLVSLQQFARHSVIDSTQQRNVGTKQTFFCSYKIRVKHVLHEFFSQLSVHNGAKILFITVIVTRLVDLCLNYTTIGIMLALYSIFLCSSDYV